MSADYLHARGLIPRSTLQSIPTDRLLPKAREILLKRRRNPAHAAEAEEIARAVGLLDTKMLLGTLVRVLGGELSRWGRTGLFDHADEVAGSSGTWQCICRSRVRPPDLRAGHDVEIEFAPRDASFLSWQGGWGLHGR